MALNSKTNLHVVDIIGEGPIEGLTKNRNSIFLDETEVPGKRAGTYDFEFKDGMPKQPPFSDQTAFKDNVTTLIDVGVQVGANYSETVDAESKVTDRDYGQGVVVRTITDSFVDDIQLIFTVPKLYCQGMEGLAKGQLFFAQIKFEVAVQGSKGGYQPIDLLTTDGTTDGNIIKGISTSNYQIKTQPIKLDERKFGNGPYNIRVRKKRFKNREDAFEVQINDFEDISKKTPLANTRADTLIWSSIIARKNVKINYANTACIASSIDSELFNTLPKRAYQVRGLKVKIPSNATPRADGSLEYNNTIPFDGQLKDGLHWTTCPICCFYDMLTNARYGAGDFIDAANVSWIDLIELSKYANELINKDFSNPAAGTEPRFAINTVIGSRADAYNVLQDLASVFRGMIYWKSDTVQVAADHGNLDGSVLDPVHVFNNSSVVGGGFEYSGSSLKTRSTRVTVRYNDPDNFYKPDHVIIENRALIDKYGFQERDVVAFGCTSKYQAQRMGRWILTSEEVDGNIVSFSVGLEGLAVLPGQIFAVSDAMRQGARLAGRVAGAEFDFVIGDQTITLPSGSNNVLTVVLPDGTVEAKPISSVVGTRINVSSPFSQIPADDAVYTISNNSVENQKFRCLSVGEGEGGVYVITGVQHVDNVYSVVEGKDSQLDFADISIFDEKPNAPTDLQVTFAEISQNDNTVNRTTFSWSRGLEATAVKFKVRYRVGSGNDIEAETTNTYINIDGLPVGATFFGQVKSVGPAPNNKESVFATLTVAIGSPDISTGVDGLTSQTLPPDPENVTIEAVGKDQAVLRWNVPSIGGNILNLTAVVRHSDKTSTTNPASWADGSLLRTVEARAGYVSLPLIEGTYLVKFETKTGIRSQNAIIAIINLPDGIPRFNLEVINEHQDPFEFQGQKDGVYYNDDLDGLVLGGDAFLDDISGTFDNLTSVDFIGTQNASGVYHFAKTLDLGAKYSILLKRRLLMRGIYTSDLIDSRTELINNWTDFDGLVPDDTNVSVYFRKTDNASVDEYQVTEDGFSLQLEDASKIKLNSNLEFEDWIPLENGNYVGRQFQFKAELETFHPDQTPLIDQLGCLIQLERRVESSQLIYSGEGTKDVAFEYPFYVDADTKVAVSIVAYDMQTDDYFEMSEATATGFSVTFKTSFDGDQVVSRRFRYTATGYGTLQPTTP